ncbi:Helix-turn-helix transcriptional regulator [Sulfidibacter corallicola]|uniref:Helix-turn-helix transcriptional regulator n=1 Tax=Sulfidibacter corallicola TaxID=2818388 RepID=A0A8A4TNZ2_SULCO|nr:helix-turn-helix transcriptional regulator [Sulfidibacter corallicola]
MVAYLEAMDKVFKALADPQRRLLLDRLFECDGLSLKDLVEGLDISRQAVAKHLHLLEDAGLVVIHWQGRVKLHYLNPIPIRQIHDRWISKFSVPRVQALVDLARDLEQSGKKGDEP